MNTKKHVMIYTRGVSSASGTGGYGIVLLCDDCRKESSGSVSDSSNNRMDILAAVEGLLALKFPCRVTLYNTNTYLIDAISKAWARRWQEKGWRNSEQRPKPHADLWDALLELCSIHDVECVWLRFDPSNPEYGRCDRLAHQAAAGQIGEVHGVIT
jgi:ribonuclease HI